MRVDQQECPSSMQSAFASGLDALRLISLRKGGAAMRGTGQKPAANSFICSTRCVSVPLEQPRRAHHAHQNPPLPARMWLIDPWIYIEAAVRFTGCRMMKAPSLTRAAGIAAGGGSTPYQRQGLVERILMSRPHNGRCPREKTALELRAKV
jgi:hypothetical protein